MAVIDNLVAYYSLDEASGDAIDAHGSNDLTDVSTVGATTGKVSGGRDFESSAVEYFTINDNADFSLSTDTAFSIACWVKFESFDTYMGLVAKVVDGSGTGDEYCLDWKADGARVRFYVGNGSSFQQVVATGASSAGVWEFVVAWHDPVENKLFIQRDNGTPDETAWSGGTQNTAAPFRLGDDNGLTLDGVLDEVGFWKKVLTSGERTWLYNSGNGRSYADIVAEAGGGTAVKAFHHYRKRRAA